MPHQVPFGGTEVDMDGSEEEEEGEEEMEVEGAPLQAAVAAADPVGMEVEGAAATLHHQQVGTSELGPHSGTWLKQSSHAMLCCERLQRLVD